MLRTFKKNHLSQLVAGVLLGQGATLAFAQGGGLEEVVVTAERRQDTVQNIPIAITALSEQELATKGITDLAGVAAATPSMYVAPYPGSNQALQLFMRGQGNADPGQITADGAVGVYLDGIYIGRPQAASFDLADIERVEVLRGPQGTLYGRNTTGGAVNIISKKPSGEFGFRQVLSFGNRDYFRSLTTIDLPRVGDVAAKVSLLRSKKDGYVKNVGNGADYNQEEQQAGRLALRWDVSENFALDYIFETGDLDATPMYFYNPMLFDILPNYSIDRDRTYRAIDLKESSSRYSAHTLNLSWDVSPTLNVKSLTSYREFRNHVYQNYAESFRIFFENAIPIDNHQFSQEFQFNGLLFEDRIKYAAGLYYFEESSSIDQEIWQGFPFPPYSAQINDELRSVRSDAKSQAVYGQLTWTPPVLSDNLDLTLGARYSRDERDASRTVINRLTGTVEEDNVRNDLKFNRFNPAFTANYRWTDDLNTYFKVSTGFRAGGSSQAGPDFTKTYGPEKVTTYELGAKAHWWDRRLRSNIALFRTDYRDMHIVISPDAANLSVTETVNAGRARYNGVEIDLTAAPTDNLTLNLSYAYLDTKVVKVKDPDTGENITKRYAIPLAPEHSYDVSVDYTFARFSNAEMMLHLDYRWQDGAYMSGTSGPAVANGDFFERPSFGLLNGRILMAFDLPRGDRAQVALWGKNLTDRKYKLFTIGMGDYEQGYVGQAFSYGEPRSYGIELTYEY